ncbi:MAG: ABC transporter ATP-binding protein, partial [Candidatus Sulfotelmatobacter sp.]
MAGKQDSWNGWRERIAALRNVPAVLRIVWESGRTVVVLGVVFRVVASVLPLGLLWITKLIIDILVRAHTTHEPVGTRLWWLVAAEFSLAVFGSVVSRGVDFLDALLADKYTRHVSVLVMKHAAQLDLTAYEDPVFYDRLERARVQATDRLGMIQSIGRLLQQVITTISLSVAIMLFSPWLLLMLVACVVPAFLGESHFAFLGYAKNFRQTPVRRQLDYLRVLGGSKEAAKELKLFGLAPFLTERFSRLSNQIYEEDVDLARRRLTAGSFLSTISTAGYYLAYVFVIWRTVIGVLSIGTFTFLAGAIQQASSNIQQIFSTVSSIADQALFLTDLIAFFEMRPMIASKPNALPAPRPIIRGFEFRNVSFRYPGSSRL